MNNRPTRPSDRDLAAARRDGDGDARDVAGERRDGASDDRDALGDRRDIVGDRRDDAAVERDHLAERADERNEQLNPVKRAHNAAVRLEAAWDRDASKRDRDAGASDRFHSGEDRTSSLADREEALTDRELSADQRQSSALDPLTGAYLRGAGLIELEREMARARRTGEPLTVAFVDIDHLKSVNDSRGHSEGDRLIVRVAETLQMEHRAYDVTIRFGGDEFLCVIQGLDMAGAHTRLEAVNAALAAGAKGGSVSVGLAQMRPSDSIDRLVERADKAMYEDRRRRRGPDN